MKNFQIAGYVGITPELKNSNDTNYTNLRGATRARNGKTDWFTIAVFDKLAENVAKHVTKGTAVGVTGELRVNKYQGKETIQLIASKVDFLGKGKGEGEEDDSKVPF